jgi:spore germination protein YaaH
MKPLLWLSLGCLLFTSAAEAKPIALFYMTGDPNSVRSFFAHSKKIDLLVPTWYEVDQDGLVSGEPEPAVLEQAHHEHLPVMPIIALMNKKQFHLLVLNHQAQKEMNAAMIRESRLHGYTGFQFDFEDIDWTDRDALTALVRNSATEMHNAGLQLSIATVPNAPGAPAGKGGFAKWIYSDWRGAYDIGELAKAVDLLCLMTYDQQTRWTMPGPVAGWQWTVDNLDYALKVVPKEKLSLGIPLYGYHWYTGAPLIDKTTGEETPNHAADYINAIDAIQLSTDYRASVEWDAVDHSAYFWFYRDQMREWVFYTDLHTFQDRYELVKNQALQGFCSWVLGAEDPEIWKYLPDRQ